MVYYILFDKNILVVLNDAVKRSLWSTINTIMMVISHFKGFQFMSIISEQELTMVLKYEALPTSCLTEIWKNYCLFEVLRKSNLFMNN